MTRYFLENLKIEGFRGINNDGDPLELKFKPTSVNSVFAVNGSGKSSIFEALTYAIRGSIPKLDGLPAQDKGDSYVTNLFHSQKTATIDLTFVADDGTAPKVEVKVVRDPQGVRKVSSPSGEPKPEEFLKSLDREFSLVDYQTFSRFMEDSPLDRGRSFSSLVGLAKYSNMRQSLQSISDTRAFNSEFDIKSVEASIVPTARARDVEFKAMISPFESLTGLTLEPELTLDSIKKATLDSLSRLELVRPHVEGRDLHKIDFDSVRDSLIAAEGGPKRTEIAKLSERISELESIGECDLLALADEVKKLEILIDERHELAAMSIGPLHRSLYQDAQNLLGSPEWDADSVCPLCNSRLDFSLSTTVDEQLAKLRHLIDKEREMTELYEGSDLSDRLTKLEGAGISVEPPLEKIGAATRASCVKGSLDKTDCSNVLKTITALDKARKEEIKLKTERRINLEKELPPSLVQLMSQVDNGRQVSSFLSQIYTHDAKMGLLKKKRNLYSRWLNFLSAVSTSFAEAETQLSASVLSSIDTEHKRLFSEIMRAGNIEPLLARESSRQDLQVKLSNFHGLSGVSAQALLSESYLNAFAISIFLAAAGRDSSASRFIVMDDITSSFDSGHQWQLMEQIRCTLQHTGNADGLQFIILSHDGLLEKYFDTLGSNSNWNHQKLQGWPPLGSVAPAGQDAGRLGTTIRKFLLAGQVSEAEPLIRQYLEFKLLQIIAKLHIPVPLDFAIKDSQKMVGNSITAMQAAIHLHERAGDLVLEASQVDNFEKRRIPAIVGNFTNHYTTGSTSNFTPPLLLGVMDDIDALDDCFKFDKTTNGKVERTWYKSLCKKS